MIRRARQVAGRCSPIALIVVLALSTSGVLHSAVPDDLACDRLPVLHDASQHHFAAGQTDRTPDRDSDHCFLCHWQRSLHSLVASTELVHIGAGVSGSLAALLSLPESSLVPIGLPARSPPA